jgi:glycosyltransferase involved in cell wall biosynthesis
VGLTNQQARLLPDGISSVRRTDSVQELVELYANSDVFVNPSQAESFGMTTAEALSCGTPAIVYDTTACPELVDEDTGSVVPLDDINALADSVRKWCENPQRIKTRKLCRERAVSLFSRQDRYQEYFDLYSSLLK